MRVENDLQTVYLRRLEPWPLAMRGYFYEVPGDRASACFGPGNHENWSMQANSTAAAALAVLVADPETNWNQAGMSRDEMLSWALRMIHFHLVSHHAGGGTATDLQPWGHSWISALSLERLMHGVEALGDLLPDADRHLLGRVLVSECDWLLDHYEVVAGLVENNKPESNIWNGCLLLRTALLVPDAPRRDAYVDKGTRFLVNGISIPDDATCQEQIAGRSVAQWHVGANMFNSLACNHHGYLNVGYMVICLSNIAMLHFSCRANGWTAPEGLYHHVRELWQLVKTCTFPDGRLWRVGGDTRVRYCYCQDYAIPVWMLVRDLFGDSDVDALERGWLQNLDRETDGTTDGSFLSTRLGSLEAVSPLYYVRLEGDRAVSLSMGAYWHRVFGQPASEVSDHTSSAEGIPILTEWSDEYHGSTLVRGNRRLVSWTWGAAQPPQGLCAPPYGSSMVEWQGNLGVRIRGMGALNDPRCQPGQSESFSGGFATCGQVTVHTHQHVSEGDPAHDAALTDLACIALPDDRTLVVLQRARVHGRTWLCEAKGLFLQIPNDVFNRMRRTYQHAEGQFELEGCPSRAETRVIPGNWLSIDSCLSVVRIFGPDLIINRPAARQVVIKPHIHRQHTERAGGNLYVDEICCGCQVGTRAYDAHDDLFDLGTLILSDVSAEETALLVQEHPPAAFTSSTPDIRGAYVIGADKRRYLVIANFGNREIAVESTSLLDGGSPHPIAGATVRATRDGEAQIVIASMHAAILVGD